MNTTDIEPNRTATALQRIKNIADIQPTTIHLCKYIDPGPTWVANTLLLAQQAGDMGT